MNTFNLQQIQSRLDVKKAFNLIKLGFIKHARGEVLLPPTGALLLDEGSLHIKYGYSQGDDFFYVKHSTGFSGNKEKELSTSDGCILAFNAKTGLLTNILFDEGYLTHMRTALGASVVINSCIDKPQVISILGSGMQAFYQAQVQKIIYPEACIKIWARDKKKLALLKSNLASIGVESTCETSLKSCLYDSDVAISVTASKSYFISTSDLPKSILLVAMGADEPGKQELEPEILLLADKVIVDKLSQCKHDGELQHLTDAQVNQVNPISLGDYLQEPCAHSLESKIIIVDMTGLAIQDIQIAHSIFA